jgi:hypothetical protein
VEVRFDLRHRPRRRLFGGVKTFDVTIDVRLRISDRSVKTGVPVAIVHIDTDAVNRELWLQLTRGDVEDTIKTLSQSLEDMKVAEEFILKKR